MSAEPGQSHTLDGFPAAAVHFVNVMQLNREKIAERAGISPTELRALFRVAAVVSVTPKQLAEYLDMTTAAITFISRRLVESDLLHRVDNPLDRRSLYLELTPRAHEMMLEIHRDFVALLDAATSELDGPALDVFSNALTSVARSMESHSVDVASTRKLDPSAASGHAADSATHL